MARLTRTFPELSKGSKAGTNTYSRAIFLSQNYYGLSWSGLRAAFTHFSRGFALITQAKGEVSTPPPSSDSCQTPNPDSLKLKPTLLRLILKSLKLKAASELNRS